MTHSSKYPSTLFGLLVTRLLLFLKPKSVYSEPIASDGDRLARERRSVFLRHLDCGSCNGCELELDALSNPLYDSERFGIKFEASPRHADALILTGAFTHNLAQAADMTLSAMSEPKRVITVGDCAINGGIFRDSYAVASRSQALEDAVVAHVAGCPPTPTDILRAVAKVDW